MVQFSRIVILLAVTAMAVSSLSIVSPQSALRYFGLQKGSAASSSTLNGEQAQRVYIEMMEAIVHSNMTALAEVCDDNMTFIVEGWAPNADRAPDACWPRGKDAFVAHVHGFVTLFNLSVAWIEEASAAFDTVFVDVGFSFVGGPDHKMVVAPQTMQILQIVKATDGKWKIGYFLEIGSWHNSTRDALMVNTWMKLAEGIATKNASLFAPYLAPNLTVNAYFTGANKSSPAANRSVFLDEVYGRWAIQAYGNFVTSHAFASCRFAWATAVFPWIDTNGAPYVYRMMFMLEFAYDALSSGVPLVTKWWQIKDEGPQNPFPFPPPMPDPR